MVSYGANGKSFYGNGRKKKSKPRQPSHLHAMLQRRGAGSKMIEGLGTHFFELGGYKIEPLLTEMVNKVNNEV